ncbi:hypothetical protein MPTK2_6g14840 [Marchantia polymorpha subsp. ruderalis]
MDVVGFLPSFPSTGARRLLSSVSQSVRRSVVVVVEEGSRDFFLFEVPPNFMIPPRRASRCPLRETFVIAVAARSDRFRSALREMEKEERGRRRRRRRRGGGGGGGRRVPRKKEEEADESATTRSRRRRRRRGAEAAEDSALASREEKGAEAERGEAVVAEREEGRKEGR